MAKDIYGIIPAVVTPFDNDEKVNEKAFRNIINYLISKGVHGLFVVGSQGEFFSLAMDEKKRLIDVAVEETNGRIAVMPNTGEITTRDSIELCKHAEKAGADAVSIITPFFITPSQDELFSHFKAICDSISIPVYAYNNPDRTGGLALNIKTITKLIEAAHNFKGIKDSSGDMTNFLELIRLTPKDFKVIMGRDTLICSALIAGGAGAIAATANVAPALIVGIYNAVRANDLEKAKELQRKLAPLRIAFGLGSFPVVVKDALTMMGIPAGKCRRPIESLKEDKIAQLRQILSGMGLLNS